MMGLQPKSKKKTRIPFGVGISLARLILPLSKLPDAGQKYLKHCTQHKSRKREREKEEEANLSSRPRQRYSQRQDRELNIRHTQSQTRGASQKTSQDTCNDRQPLSALFVLLARKQLRQQTERAVERAEKSIKRERQCARLFAVELDYDTLGTPPPSSHQNLSTHTHTRVLVYYARMALPLFRPKWNWITA